MKPSKNILTFFAFLSATQSSFFIHSMEASKENETSVTFKQEKKLCNSTSNISLIKGSPDNTRLLIGFQNGTAVLCKIDPETNSFTTVKRTIKAHSDSVTCAAFSSHNDFIITGSNDHTVCYWDLKSNIPFILQKHTDRVSSVAISPDQTAILTGSWDHSICLWDTQRKKFCYQKKLNKGIVSSVAFDSNQETSLMLIGHSNNLAQLISNHEVKHFKGHTDMLHRVAFSPTTSTLILTASTDRTVRLWNSKTGNELKKLQHPKGVTFAKFSLDGKTILTIAGGVVYLWNIQTGALLHTLQTNDYSICGAVLSSDYTWIIVHAQAGALYLWTLPKAAAWEIQNGAEPVFLETTQTSQTERVKPQKPKVESNSSQDTSSTCETTDHVVSFSTGLDIHNSQQKNCCIQ